jgi:hypothetical protein
MKQAVLSLTIALFLSCSVAQADVIFTLGNNPQPNEENITLNSGLSGLVVTGTANLSGTTVNFSSSQILVAPSSGQARVTANPEGTPLTFLSITLGGGLTYGDLIINPFLGGPGVCPACTGGASTITVNALTSVGTPELFVFTGLNVGTGNNFLTVTTTGGERIVSTSISVPGGFNDLRQPRISGPFTPTTVPEPAAVTLIGSGLLALGLIQRFRIRRKR